MANYGRIHLKQATTPLDLEDQLRKAAIGLWGDKLLVVRPGWDDGGPVWFAFLPGTGTADEALAQARCVGLGDPFGFCVALQDDGTTVAFRHSLQQFERWLQGCMEEQLSENLGLPIHYDATDEWIPPGVKRYRSCLSFKAYLGYDLPLSEADEASFERHKAMAPEGWW